MKWSLPISVFKFSYWTFNNRLLRHSWTPAVLWGCCCCLWPDTGGVYMRHFYSPVDKIWSPVWRWLLWTDTCPSWAGPSDVYTQQKLFCVGECVCCHGCHCSALHIIELRVLIHRQATVFPLINWLFTTCFSLPKVYGVSRSMFSSVVNWCHCSLCVLTGSCLDQMKTQQIWGVKI